MFHKPSAGSGDAAYRDWPAGIEGREPSRGGVVQSGFEISGLTVRGGERIIASGASGYFGTAPYPVAKAIRNRERICLPNEIFSRLAPEYRNPLCTSFLSMNHRSPRHVLEYASLLAL
jgi:hypothetical protein